MGKQHHRWIADLLLVAGLTAVAAAPIAWYFATPFPASEAQAPAKRAMLERAALQMQERETDEAIERPSETAPLERCGFLPVIPPAGAADGRARLEHPFPVGPRVKSRIYARAAEQAAAAGRLRDAETALLAACRESERASPAPNVPLARRLERLGDHYVRAAAATPTPELYGVLIERARELLTSSATVYEGALGPMASRSRLARRRILELDKVAPATWDAAQEDRAAANGPESVASRSPASVPSSRSTSSDAGGSAPVALSGDATASKTRQAAQMKAIEEESPEMAQLASDLARLRAQAEAVSDDPAGFRMRSDAALGRKAQCRSAACLRQWYAERRTELLAEF